MMDEYEMRRLLLVHHVQKGSRRILCEEDSKALLLKVLGFRVPLISRNRSGHASFH